MGDSVPWSLRNDGAESHAAEMSLIIAESCSLVSLQDSEDSYPPSVACFPSIPHDPFLLSSTHTTPAQLYLVREREEGASEDEGRERGREGERGGGSEGYREGGREGGREREISWGAFCVNTKHVSETEVFDTQAL